MDKKANKKINMPLFILIIIDILLLGLFIYNIINLDILPTRRIIEYVVIVFLVHIIIYLIGLLKPKFFKILRYILLIIAIAISGVGIYYTNVTFKFLKQSFNQVSSSYKNSYVLLSTNNYDEVYDFMYQDIAYYSKIPHMDLSLDKLKSVIEYNSISIDNIKELFTYDNVLIEQNIYSTLKDVITDIDFGKYKKVYEYAIDIDEELENNELKDIVTIYIGGVDFTDAFNDLNMLVTINRKTHKVLLTSIPRDYYFYFDDIETNELLDYTLLWGVNVPMNGLSKLFDVDIDYYLTINTKSIVGLVDEIGGLNFCADFAFTTTHATILDTYDDSKGTRLHVQKGCHEYNGIEILTIARERKVFVGGDRQRQKNCQQILINVVNKLMSFDSVTKYTTLLNKLSDLYVTNIPDKLVTSVAKDMIDGNKYEIETQSADGYSSTGWMHVNTYYGGVMKPYQDSVEQVKAKLNEYYE